MPAFTLKTRVALIFPTVITIALACILFLMHSMLQSYIKNSISSHQYQMLSLLADDIDQSIADNHETLAVIAGRVSPETVESPKQALKYLQSQSEHLTYFDNGLFLFDQRGRLVADTALGLARSGQDFSFREYLQKTIATRKPFISDPYQSTLQHHHPVIMFTVPVFDREGALIAVLGGSVDLTRSSLVEKLSRIKLTKGGYVYLYNKERMLISHPDKTRIMKRDVPPGANNLFDRAIAGFEGTDETVTSRGLRTLSSFKHLKTKNWIIAANYPVKEAFAPLNKLRNLFLITLPLLSLATFWFMRRHLKRLTDPIVNLTSHVEGLHQKNGQERMFPLQGGDEVAILGQAFNALVLENDRQREKLLIDLERREQIDSHLQRQNGYLQALHETTVGLISRHDVAGLLQAIVNRAGHLVGTEHCFVYLKNAAGTEMDMLFQSGIYDSLVHHPIKPGQGVAGLVWDNGEPFHVDDYSLWEGRLIDSGRDQLHAMAGVPLKAGDEVVGVLGLAFVERGVVFKDEQMDLLARFGELASLALENARLNEEFRRELAERKKAEEHLRKLSVAVEQSPVSIIITDTSGRIEYVNPHFALLTGYQQDEILGKNPGILKTGETSPEEYRQLWETILSGREWRGEFRNCKKNGELYWEQALIAPIRDENGAITHFICIKEDITERKQLENQLRHSQKMEAIGQLAGGIAHDFNNILTAIIGFASIIQLKLPDDSPLKKNAGQVVAAAERGASLTQGLLAFSRKQTTNLYIIDLNEILGRIHQLLLRLISEDIHLELIPAPLPLPVMADSVQIEQVFMNLVTNARDAMPKGGQIVISTEVIRLDNEFVLARGFGQTGDYAMLTVTDNGEGMEAEVVKHVFEPFYTTKELGKGTGLGLSIVYGIIKKHNGYITCHSTVGIGTTLQIYLPLLSETPVPAVLKTEGHSPTRPGSDLILVAEDDDAARLLARNVLEEFGYSVLEAKDGLAALELFRNNRERISLVMLDVIMPKLSGREVYEAIRGLDASVKVLFCSGYSEDVVTRPGGLESGLAYLPKPYSPKELLMKIREVLNNGN
ncbi:MAG: PAS domain S-box protein [Steroidobacteraceae bacterium]|nr:PAS domain S-box protein [Deltaproteobacteria bacterium]